MSHRPLRDNKTCLNCGHEVPIRYCTYCGQENIVPEEKFSHLAHHFFEDITHYDSKFFLTLRDLIIKPGFLTKEYIAGRRVSYLNPVRMYVFISFLFFLLLFSFNYHNNVHIKQESASNIGDISQNRKFSPEDSAAIKAAEDQANAADNTLMLSSPRQYDSLQSALPPDKRQGRFLQFFNRKYLAIKSQYGERTGEVLMERFQHNIPKVMFILLPFFAVLLKLFYRKKRWLYVNHVIFSIHIHCFIFVLLMFCMLLDTIFNASYFLLLSWSVMFIYFVIALRNTFQRSLLRSFFKACLIIALYGFGISIALAGAAVISFLLA